MSCCQVDDSGDGGASQESELSQVVDDVPEGVAVVEDVSKDDANSLVIIKYYSLFWMAALVLLYR